MSLFNEPAICQIPHLVIVFLAGTSNPNSEKGILKHDIHEGIITIADYRQTDT